MALDDESLQQVLDAVMPLIGDAMAATLVEAAALPSLAVRLATMQGYLPSTNTATVLVDGDTSTITALVVGEPPVVGDRVMMLFAPPAAVWVMGAIGHGGVPASGVIAYLGTITVDTTGSAAAAARIVRARCGPTLHQSVDLEHVGRHSLLPARLVHDEIQRQA